jgi:hypothetical protein
MREINIAYKILVEKPQGKSLIGGNIKMYLKKGEYEDVKYVDYMPQVRGQ